MARVGKGPGSKVPVTVYLEPDIHAAVVELAHEARSSESAWCAAAVMRDTVQRVTTRKKTKPSR